MPVQRHYLDREQTRILDVVIDANHTPEKVALDGVSLEPVHDEMKGKKRYLDFSIEEGELSIVYQKFPPVLDIRLNDKLIPSHRKHPFKRTRTISNALLVWFGLAIVFRVSTVRFDEAYLMSDSFITLLVVLLGGTGAYFLRKGHVWAAGMVMLICVSDVVVPVFIGAADFDFSLALLFRVWFAYLSIKGLMAAIAYRKLDAIANQSEVLDNLSNLEPEDSEH